MLTENKTLNEQIKKSFGISPKYVRIIKFHSNWFAQLYRREMCIYDRQYIIPKLNIFDLGNLRTDISAKTGDYFFNQTFKLIYLLKLDIDFLKAGPLNGFIC